MSKKQLGVVRNYKPERGYGFVRALEKMPDGGVRPLSPALDIFVHASQLKRSGIGSLEKQDVILFDVATDAKSGKPHAVNIERTA